LHTQGCVGAGGLLHVVTLHACFMLSQFMPASCCHTSCLLHVVTMHACFMLSHFMPALCGHNSCLLHVVTMHACFMLSHFMPASCCHNACLLHVATLHAAGKPRCWPQVVNRDELLNSLEDIATAFDMRVRPYSATSGQTFSLLTPPTALVVHTFRHFYLSPACLCRMRQLCPIHCSG